MYHIGTGGDFNWGCDVLEPFESVLEQDKLMMRNGIEIKKGVQGRPCAKERCTSSSWSPANAKLKENVFGGTCIKKK